MWYVINVDIFVDFFFSIQRFYCFTDFLFCFNGGYLMFESEVVNSKQVSNLPKVVIKC